MVNVIGWDIGGANTKAAFLNTEAGAIKEVKVAVEYFPVWKEPQKLTDVLLKLKAQLYSGKLDGVGVTMTAELSDAYQTKREGVNHILACVQEAFADTPVYVLTVDAKLESMDDARQDPLGVAAANWAATGWLVSQYFENCVVVDVGSTSTSIIPILNGHVSALGKTDLEKLMCGELVYTGSLRTNVAAIVNSIPVKGGEAGVASELFALSGDVHLVLGNITEEQYTSETADGRGKSRQEALARLARVVCADTEMLTEKEITDMAKYVYEKQILQVASGLSQVYARAKKFASTKLPVLVAGLGKDFIARKAAEKIGVDVVMDLGELLPRGVSLAVPVVGVALMTSKKLESEA
ncbi:H4MPT-linked C1 transfer pathway protein [Candidatus Bathyarchaeota archaeon]|nr:H4MPT-linked C1 transfer pathway protein [Candidatus Bathyarchaeota archaeon]